MIFTIKEMFQIWLTAIVIMLMSAITTFGILAILMWIVQ
jgi:hypothetical protein